MTNLINCSKYGHVEEFLLHKYKIGTHGIFTLFTQNTRQFYFHHFQCKIIKHSIPTMAVGTCVSNAAEIYTCSFFIYFSVLTINLFILEAINSKENKINWLHKNSWSDFSSLVTHLRGNRQKLFKFKNIFNFFYGLKKFTPSFSACNDPNRNR